MNIDSSHLFPVFSHFDHNLMRLNLEKKINGLEGRKSELLSSLWLFLAELC